MENVRAHDERRVAKTAKPTADPTTSAKGLLKHRRGKAEKVDQSPQDESLGKPLEAYGSQIKREKKN